jgi:hypothetical protein
MLTALTTGSVLALAPARLKFTKLMISRGHYIGEIVDEISAISEQVKLRNKLGMTDLTVIVENFFRDVLNATLDAQLENLNKKRSNEPGLDLGDEKIGLGIQVTSTASSDKVNKTLEKITTDQAARYQKIVVLAIGRRQTSYTLKPALVEKHKFIEDNIWDIDTLARQVVSLEIDRLQEVHRVVRANTVRLRIELEVPDDDGKYPTSGFDHWEPRIATKPGSGEPFLKFYDTEYAKLDDAERAKVRKAIARLADRLILLPRITREFLAMLFERREPGKSRRHPAAFTPHLLLSKVKREYRGNDLNGELSILEHAGFVDIEGEDPHEYGPPEINVTISRNDDLLGGFVDFIEKSGLSFRRVIGEADLSAF